MYKKKYLEMINVAEDKSDAEFIFMEVDKYRKYVNAVIAMELQIPVLRFTCPDTESFQNAVMELDKQRRIVHNSAISACTILNRYCENHGLEKWFDGDVEDRHAVAEFCEKVVSNLFMNGITPEQNINKINEEELLSMCK